MGQKVNPISFRVGINKTWNSRWFARDDYADKLHEDLQIRKYIKESMAGAGISSIIIERPTKKANITIHTARPGVVIGKKGADIEKIKKSLAKFISDEINLNIIEIRKPELDATLIAETVSQQLEKRASFRRVMKRAMQSAMRLGAEGIRINCSGRLGGSEIARMEWYREGRVPLHTLRADVDYGVSEALTTYGIIGVKVWVYKGMLLDEKATRKAEEENMAETEDMAINASDSATDTTDKIGKADDNKADDDKIVAKNTTDDKKQNLTSDVASDVAVDTSDTINDVAAAADVDDNVTKS